MDFSIFIGGQAGEGIKRGSMLIGKVFNRYGYHVFIMNDYGSIIRGGTDYSEIRVSTKEIHTSFNKFDYMFAFHMDVFEKYKDKAKENCFILTLNDFPYDDIIKNTEGEPFMKPSIVLGVLTYLLGIPQNFVESVIEDDLGRNAPKNIELFRIGLQMARDRNFKTIHLLKGEKTPKPLLYGNDAIGLGAVRAGMKVYAAYPITPSSTLLEFLAKNADRFGIVALQLEDEIAAINLALGSAYAGVPSMVGTSGAGLDLMGETISLAGAVETPIVILDVQRVGPSTGAPTYTEQSDLNLALNIGHGEFPRIVLAPGDVEEAFEVTAKAFQFAWWYQTPVIILSDKHISESARTTDIPFSNNYPMLVKTYDKDFDGPYHRYKITPDGISPFAFPQTPDVVVHVNSTEHTEEGYSSSLPETLTKMKEKRLKKMKTIEEDFKLMRFINVFNEDDVAVVSFGSPKGAILEAIENLPIKFIQVISLEPFPKEALLEELEGVKKVISVEQNSFGQFADLFERKTNKKIDKRILKYDGRPFSPWELRSAFEEVLR
ncbi:2-oxoacid:acceptor oxidoreductase subunit alpha [Caldisericum exile]|uniref:2-oxoglutarate ferredoxin oxidoreductase alpha subunit n=1 Tax=Caldisericum exile (strain DSM 21853 / NBRC 104410 / AZM16c01) TaxID=511051 RepID=A0A7U6GFZ3_CALEA|nr:2-oxoacid:acceptor oxidoreductase subunit alpha [Caldisericum exile]BAL81706.1 2-oxoglutarate ferredoxin oxidoreductase alpha subunit [Caldisericum exile AZM16c01]